MQADLIDWVTKHDVPIYDSHLIVDKETGQHHRIDRARLQAIADRMNQRIQATGDESPIVIGHTIDGKPEWQQPPIVGYMDDFYVEDHPTAGRPFLYARNYRLYPKSHVGGEELTAEEIMKRFPRRSPEVWLKRNEIDPLALLGPTTPMRDLGLVRCERDYKRDGDGRFASGGDVFDKHQTAIAKKTLQMPDAMAGVMGGPTKKQAEAFLKKKKKGSEQQEDEWRTGPPPRKDKDYDAQEREFDSDDESNKYQRKQAPMDVSAIIMAMEALLQQIKGGMMPEGDAQPQIEDPAAETGVIDEEQPIKAEAAAPAPPGETGSEAEEFTDEEGEEGAAPPAEKKKYQADQGAANASSTNSYLPGDKMDKKKCSHTAEEKELERVKMQRDQKAIEKRTLEQRLAALEADNEALRAQVQDDRLRYQREVRTGELKQMLSEGYALDVAEEIEEVAELSDEAYSKYTDRLRKRYSRVPVGEDFIRTAPIRDSKAPKTSPEVASKAVEIAGKRSVDFATALKMAQSGEF